MIGPIVARYAAPCAECGRRIDPGEIIRYSADSDGWIHGDCHPRVPITVPRCPYCADVLTTSGACESCRG